MFNFTRVTAITALAFMADAASAAIIGGSIGSNSTAYSGQLSRLIDGYFPPNGTFYTTDTVSYTDADTPTFTYSFGRVFALSQLTTTVDNNDDYSFAFYNGLQLVGTRSVLTTDGLVASGVETFTRDLTGLLADRLIVTTAGGDLRYAIGEIQVQGEIPTVPEPATWGLMILGFGVTGTTLRRRRRVRAVTA